MHRYEENRVFRSLRNEGIAAMTKSEVNKLYARCHERAALIWKHHQTATPLVREEVSPLADDILALDLAIVEKGLLPDKWRKSEERTAGPSATERKIADQLADNMIALARDCQRSRRIDWLVELANKFLSLNMHLSNGTTPKRWERE
jgi:hypothetical protein